MIPYRETALALTLLAGASAAANAQVTVTPENVTVTYTHTGDSCLIFTIDKLPSLSFSITLSPHLLLDSTGTPTGEVSHVPANAAAMEADVIAHAIRGKPFNHFVYRPDRLAQCNDGGNQGGGYQAMDFDTAYPSPR